MAMLDTGKIEGYAEMSAEDKIRALEAYEFEDNSAKLLAENEKLKNAVSRSNSEAADWKKKYTAKMSDEEKQQQAAAEAAAADQKEKDDLRARIAELERDKTLVEYRASLSELGFEAKLSADTAAALFDNDVPKVFANLKKFLEEFERNLKSELMAAVPQPGGAHGGEGEDKAVAFAKRRAQAKAAAAQQAAEARKQFFG